MDRRERFRSERAGIIDDGAAWQRTKRGVEMIEAWIGKRQGDRAQPESPFQRAAGRGVGAEAAAEPEQPAPAVEQAIAGAFKRDPGWQRHDLPDNAFGPQRLE